MKVSNMKGRKGKKSRVRKGSKKGGNVQRLGKKGRNKIEKTAK